MDVPTTKVPVFERGLWCRGWFLALLCAVFVGVDWEMIPLAVFPVVFIFPVMLAAWNRSLWFAMTCALLLSLSRVAYQLFLDTRPDTVDDWAAMLVRFFVLALLAALTHLLGRQDRQLRQRVRQLEGILPICAGCKSIRDNGGNWLPLEGYITTHSPAQVSHSFCPDCVKVFYGDLPVRAGANK